MNPGISAQIAWSLAARETVAGGYPFIRPDHLFCATLKLAELEIGHIERLVRARTMVRPVIDERNELRSRLGDFSVQVPDDSRKIRYALRRRLGKGGQSYDGEQVIHRSATSRDICKKAEIAARKSGLSHWDASHLFEALLKSPTREMAEVLSHAGIGLFRETGHKSTPYLDRYGKDLTALAADRRKEGIETDDMDIFNDPVLKVVIDYLSGADAKNLLLIQKGPRTPGDLMARVADYRVRDDTCPPSKRKRIVSVDWSLWFREKRGADKDMVAEKTALLFDDMMEAKNTILFFEEFHRVLDGDRQDSFAGAMKAVLVNPAVPCVAGIDEEFFQRVMGKDRSWKRLFHPVWIHNLDWDLDAVRTQKVLMED